MSNNFKKYKRKNNNSNFEKHRTIDEIKFAERQRQFDKALTLLDAHLREYPNDYYMTIYKTSILIKIDRWEEAIRILEDIIHVKNLNNRELSFALINYAKLLKLLNRIDESIFYYEKAISQSEGLELIGRSELAKIYSSLKKTDEALRVLTIEDYNDRYLNTERAKSIYYAGNIDAALEELDKPTYNRLNYYFIEKMDKDYVKQNYYHFKGHLYFKKGDYETAYDYLSKSLINKKSRIYALSCVDIAKIDNIKGNLDHAISLCNEILNDDYNFKIKRNIKGVLSMAYQKSNQYKKALELYNEDNLSLREKTDLAKVYLAMGEFEKADEMMKDLEIDENKFDELADSIFTSLKIKYRLEQYDEALKLVSMYEENINDNNCDKYSNVIEEISKIKIIIFKKFGKEDLESKYYSENQIINYSEKRAITHIKRHHIENPLYNDFYDGVDIEKLFYTVKEKMNESVVYYDTVLDRHILSYKGIGYDDKGSINELCVITLPNSDQILTMFPSKGYNINTIEEKKKDKKVKRLSQIEKFNKKYGNN